MAKGKVSPQIVGNCGLFYVCFQLSRRGWNAMPTSRNARGVDVVCFSIDGRRMLTIQVKSLSKKNPVPLGSDLEKIMGDFWIIATKATQEIPECYILLPHEVRALAHRTEKDGRVAYWLEPKHYAVDHFRESWQRVGSGLG